MITHLGPTLRGDAIRMLNHVSIALSSGRPRKRPGRPRPLYDRMTGRRSLKGALDEAWRYAILDTPRSSANKVKKTCREAIIEASGWPALKGVNIDAYGGPLVYLDEVEDDTREIRRIVHRARRLIEAQGRN